MDISRLMFSALLGAALGLAALFVLAARAARLIRRRIGLTPAAAPGGRRRLSTTLRWSGHAVLAAAAIGLLCPVWARFVEPYWPKVERLRVETGKLPAGTRPLRLVLLADTHCDPRARAEPRVLELVRELKPDTIVFAGDALNSAEGLPVFRELMAGLARLAPTYAVRGNWDVWYFAGVDMYAGTGVELLDGRAVPVRAGGAEIWLAGFAVLDGRKDTHAAAANKALAAVPAGRFTVFVHHYPEAAGLGVSAGADLGLAADTHGGQVRLPFLGGLVRLSRFGQYIDIGSHEVAGGRLYVNRGLGMEGGRAPRLRFMCRPEITLIEIAPAAQPPNAPAMLFR